MVPPRASAKLVVRITQMYSTTELKSRTEDWNLDVRTTRKCFYLGRRSLLCTDTGAEERSECAALCASTRCPAAICTRTVTLAPGPASDHLSANPLTRPWRCRRELARVSQREPTRCCSAAVTCPGDPAPRTLADATAPEASTSLPTATNDKVTRGARERAAAAPGARRHKHQGATNARAFPPGLPHCLTHQAKEGSGAPDSLSREFRLSGRLTVSAGLRGEDAAALALVLVDRSFGNHAASEKSCPAPLRSCSPVRSPSAVLLTLQQHGKVLIGRRFLIGETGFEFATPPPDCSHGGAELQPKR